MTEESVVATCISTNGPNCSFSFFLAPHHPLPFSFPSLLFTPYSLLSLSTLFPYSSLPLFSPNHITLPSPITFPFSLLQHSHHSLYPLSAAPLIQLSLFYHLPILIFPSSLFASRVLLPSLLSTITHSLHIIPSLFPSSPSPQPDTLLTPSGRCKYLMITHPGKGRIGDSIREEEEV